MSDTTTATAAPTHEVYMGRAEGYMAIRLIGPASEEQAGRLPSRQTWHTYERPDGSRYDWGITDVTPIAPEELRGTKEGDFIRALARQVGGAWWVMKHKSSRTNEYKAAEAEVAMAQDTMQRVYGAMPTPSEIERGLKDRVLAWDYYITVARFVRDAYQAMHPMGPR